MSRKSIIITFIISFIISYLFVGYVFNAMFVGIKWVEDITIWMKLREYYIRPLFNNTILATLLSTFITFIINVIFRNRKKLK
ncbi:hypothetical protein [Clostridium sp.]|uniref:hypothetical protein n=1 Tax=Clostridium sp. TaxID=1506 RepID=UPI001ED5C4D9|nr:hypothetical protein [Clostridium sp.]MBS5883548.1 hypothetical protein [Clostridium sp.]MDU7240274.1 hypothetical protein [Clostridium sp.]